jgi:hypothetical protein
MTSAPKRPGELFAALHGAVGNAMDFGWRAAKWVAARSIISPAHKQHLDVAQIFKQLAGQPHCRDRHADAVRQFRCCCAPPWPPKRALEQLVQRHAHGACALGCAHGVFHLAQGGSPSTMS